MHNYASPDIYKHYVEMGGDLSFKEFRAVICDFNERAMDEILQGRELEMESGLSRMSIIRLTRNFNKLAVNWKESHAFKAELLAAGETLFSKENPDGKKWLIYFTNDWFARFYWEKKRCQINNQSVYRFSPTGGKRGNKTKLKQLLANDPLSHLTFRHVGKA